jgi:hypothetical protein
MPLSPLQLGMCAISNNPFNTLVREGRREFLFRAAAGAVRAHCDRGARAFGACAADSLVALAV